MVFSPKNRSHTALIALLDGMRKGSTREIPYEDSTRVLVRYYGKQMGKIFRARKWKDVLVIECEGKA